MEWRKRVACHTCSKVEHRVHISVSARLLFDLVCIVFCFNFLPHDQVHTCSRTCAQQALESLARTSLSQFRLASHQTHLLVYVSGRFARWATFTPIPRCMFSTPQSTRFFIFVRRPMTTCDLLAFAHRKNHNAVFRLVYKKSQRTRCIAVLFPCAESCRSSALLPMGSRENLTSRIESGKTTRVKHVINSN